MPSVPSQHKANHKGAAFGRPPLWRRPKAASFVLALNTGHILLLRRKTCALLRAKTSALLRRKTCAVLRARTCALFRANTKEAAFGRLHKGGRPSAPPLCGFLYMGSPMGTGSRIWAVWAGFPDFYHANVSFVYGCPPGYAPEPIELPLGAIRLSTIAV